MKIAILGGGLSAITTAYFLQDKNYIEEIHIIEKEEKMGGLCRSFENNGITWDIGPHIIFSKDKEILDWMIKILGSNVERHRRSNRIIHDKRLVQYPFENDLSKLSEKDKFYCLNGFLHNPYENYNPTNMLQFFLSTFGEGITNIYLRPYNEKIWKFDPSFMDTQMVERIPKPPKEDIIRSANGETVDGYLHQLYFNYPKVGGTQSIIDSIIFNLNDKIKYHLNAKIDKVIKNKEGFVINFGIMNLKVDNVISTIPLNELVNIYNRFDNVENDNVKNAASALKYNSIAIAIVNVKQDRAGDNYAFMIADKSVIFHRISKLDFMGSKYHIEDSTTYMVEITYRKNDIYDHLSEDELLTEIYSGLETIGFIDNVNDVNFGLIKRFDYAYVIYDLNHKNNTKIIKDYFKEEGIFLTGRFGEFEYLNMDAVIRHAKNLVDGIN